MVIVDENSDQLSKKSSQLYPGSFYTPNSFYKKPCSLYNIIAEASELSIDKQA